MDGRLIPIIGRLDVPAGQTAAPAALAAAKVTPRTARRSQHVAGCTRSICSILSCQLICAPYMGLETPSLAAMGSRGSQAGVKIHQHALKHYRACWPAVSCLPACSSSFGLLRRSHFVDDVSCMSCPAMHACLARGNYAAHRCRPAATIVCRPVHLMTNSSGHPPCSTFKHSRRVGRASKAGAYFEGPEDWQLHEAVSGAICCCNWTTEERSE